MGLQQIRGRLEFVGQFVSIFAWLCTTGFGGTAVQLSEFVFDDAPSESCHAATIAQLADGSLAAAWFAGREEGSSDVGIWLSRKADDRWSDPVEVANGMQPQAKPYPCWNPVLFQTESEPLMLFFKVGPSPQSWWGEVMFSTDNGKTWQQRRPLPNKGIGPVKNKPVQLADGTILCPSSTEHDGWRVHIERTTDHGETWVRSGPLNDGHKIGAIQPTLLSHEGGRVQMLCRDFEVQGNVWQSWSDDNGMTWTPLSATSLPNPNAGLDGVTLRDKRQLLVYNHTHRRGSFPKSREMLNVAISQDGKDWQAAMVLERAPDEFSYPAVIQTRDGLVHIIYTWRRRTMRHVVLQPDELSLSEIKNGHWPDGVEQLPAAGI